MKTSLYEIVPLANKDKVNWNDIELLLPQEVYAMKNCMQSPTWHKEGDVWTHTKMVVDALVGMKEWQTLKDFEKNCLFWAALLHDIGKPPSSKLKEGVISSKGHAGRGARMARKIIMRDPNHISVLNRELVVGLIKAHMAPIHAFISSGYDPNKIVLRASLTVNCSLLYMLSKADVIGRIPENESSRTQTLETLEMFKELAEDKNCFNQPFPFASNHTRFMYFRKEEMLPDYERYDDTEFEVIMMAGVPGSGKDFCADKLGLPMVSLDVIRDFLSIKATDNQGEVSQKAKETCKEYLRKKQSFIFNATNVTKYTRQKMIDLFYQYKAHTKIIYIEPTFKQIVEQNENRDKKVDIEIIEKLFYKLDMPNLMECHRLEIIL